MRIAELAMQEGCATLLALNKWDLCPMTEDDLDHERAKVAAQAPPAARRSLTISAQGGRNVERVLTEAIALGDLRARADPDAGAQPLRRRGRRRPPAAGAPGAPPEAALHGADRRRARRASRCRSTAARRMTRDYGYFIENRLRKRFGLDGVPVIIDVRERKQRRSERL